MADLKNRRMIVIGASAGIGRALAIESARLGAEMLLVGRRADKLEELRAETGRGSVLVADITDEQGCERIAEAARSELGEIDVLVQAAGGAPLRRIVETTLDDWRFVLDTNIIGTHQAIRALLPLLTPSAIVAVFSSEAIGQPRAGLGAYAVSKAGLEELLRVWHNEHPGYRFSCIRVGTTVPTEFARTFEVDLLPELLEDWTQKGVAQAGFMATDDVGRFLANAIASALPHPELGLEHLTLRSPSAVVTTADLMLNIADETLGSPAA